MFDQLMGLLSDDDSDLTETLGGIGSTSPSPRRRRAGFRKYERLVNAHDALKKAVEKAKNRAAGEKLPLPPMISTRDDGTPEAPPGAGIATVAPLIPGQGSTAGAVLVAPSALRVPAAATRAASSSAAVPPRSSPAARAAVVVTRPAAAPPSRGVAAARASTRLHGMMAGLLGDPLDDHLDYSDDGGLPDPNQPQPIGPQDPNQQTSTDSVGVPPGWLPQNRAWVSNDLWESLPDNVVPHVNGVRMKHRFTAPALDMSFMLGWPDFAFLAAADDAHGIPGDDLRWDLHPPMGRYILETANMAAIVPNLLAGTQVVGDSVNVLGIASDRGGGHNIEVPRTNFFWQKYPSDYWRVDLSSGVPNWFFFLEPADMLSYYFAKTRPDGYAGSGEEFWGQVVKSTRPLDSKSELSNLPAYLAVSSTFDLAHDGRGAITVYEPSDIPNTVGGRAALGPIGTFQDPMMPTAADPGGIPLPDPNAPPYVDPALQAQQDQAWATGQLPPSNAGYNYPPGYYPPGGGYPQDQGEVGYYDEWGNFILADGSGWYDTQNNFYTADGQGDPSDIDSLTRGGAVQDFNGGSGGGQLPGSGNFSDLRDDPGDLFRSADAFGPGAEEQDVVTDNQIANTDPAAFILEQAGISDDGFAPDEQGSGNDW